MELVRARLAACVNIIAGLTSLYRWKGRVERGAEVLLIIKSSAARLARLERAVIALHPYDTPEFVVISPTKINRKYLAWLIDSLRPAPRARVRPRGGRRQ
jgi:periplasmic divalent cation tolerance protein